MIIGLSGKAGAGKDSVGNVLEKTYGFKRTALADPLKKACKEFYDFTYLQLWGPSEERNKPDLRYPRPDGTFLTPREALQLLGTDFGRRCYPDTWIEMGIRKAQELLNPSFTGTFVPKGVAITDVRFPNEIHGLKSRGAKLVRIVRPGETSLTGAAATHVSELALDDVPLSAYDYVLDNNGPLAELDVKVALMMNTLRQQTS
jgi:hypothetical protein